MWIFSSTKDYSEMVDKISHSVFVISTALLFLLSQVCNEFSQVLAKLSFGATIEIFNIKLNLAIFYCPFIMGMLEHMFKLHDIWSSLLGIRRRFDKKIIVKEIFLQCGIKKDISKLTDEQVRKIMGTCFYKYASSTNPKIDSHNITLVLTEWCWFWIILDTLILYDVVGMIWLIISWWNGRNFFVFIVIELLLIGILILVNVTTKKYSKEEVVAILKINDRDITGDKKMEEIVKEAVKNALSD